MRSSKRCAINKKLERIPKAVPFSKDQLAGNWSSRTLDRALAVMVAKGSVVRLMRGIYARPKKSEFTGRTVIPNPLQVLEFIIKAKGEVIQIHGAEAVRRLGLSTQMQLKLTYYTSGHTRRIVIGKAEIRLVKVRKSFLQHAGRPLGTLISAFHYLGSTEISRPELRRILERLSKGELDQLLASDLPKGHMAQIIEYASEHCAAAVQKSRACAENH